MYFQLFSRFLSEPKFAKELFEERAEIKQDIDHRNHKYDYNFDSVSEFFKVVFPNEDLKKYELELKKIETYTKKFFDNIKKEKFPSKKKPYPIDYSINNDSRKFLYLICRILKPKKVVETGVAYGLSSIYILNALEANNHGKLYSIDSVFRPWQTKEMIGAIIPEELEKRWTLVLGKSKDKLQELLNEITVADIFIHDSLHTYKNMKYEFSTAFEKLEKNGIIISDDILGNDAFFDFTKEMNVENHIVKVDEGAGLGIIRKN